MKKSIYLFAALAAAGSLASCSVDQVVDQATEQTIGFDAFANKAARGDASTLGHNNFSVWGRYTDDEDDTNNPKTVFTKQTVTCSGSGSDAKWTYGIPKPWVGSKFYEFAAIAPDAVNGATYDYTNNKYNFGPVEASSTTQTDYLVADIKSKVTSGTAKVDFTFNHTLAKVDFKFVPKTGAASGNWTSAVNIKVTNVTLSNVISNGSCEVIYTLDPSISKTITWTANAGDGSNLATFIDSKEEGYTASYDGTGSLTVAGPSKAWLVIPQKDSDYTNTKRTVTITCDITDGEGTTLYSSVTAKAEIDTQWEANHYYTYTLKIGTEIAQTNPYIEFDVTEVKDWTTGTTSDIEVTKP